MKKIIINISDCSYEKIAFEAVQGGKSIHEVLQERIFDRPFSEAVEFAVDQKIKNDFDNLVKE